MIQLEADNIWMFVRWLVSWHGPIRAARQTKTRTHAALYLAAVSTDSQVESFGVLGARLLVARATQTATTLKPSAINTPRLTNFFNYPGLHIRENIHPKIRWKTDTGVGKQEIMIFIQGSGRNAREIVRDLRAKVRCGLHHMHHEIWTIFY